MTSASTVYTCGDDCVQGVATLPALKKCECRYVKWLVIISCFAFSFLHAQTSPCHKVDTYLDNVERTNYWGTAVWLAKMDSAIAMCPTSARAWGDKAMVYLMRGDVVTWASLIKKAIDLNPLFYLGNRAYHRMRYLRDYEGALADLQKQDSLAGFHTLYVSDVHSYILMAQCMEGMNAYEAALSCYDKAISRQIAERGEGWVGNYDYLLRGILKLKMNLPEDAIADFDKQILQYDQLVDPYYYRGIAYQKLGEHEKAQTDLLHAKSLLQGTGSRRWDHQVILSGEVHLSDIERAINSVR